MTRILLLCTAFLLLSGVLAAGQTLDEVLDAGVANDLEYRKQQERLTIAERNEDRFWASRGVQISVNTGNQGLRLTQTFGEAASTTFDTNPGISAGLGDPYRTSVSASVPLSYTFQDGELSYSLGFGVSQPLTQFLKPASMKISRMQTELSLEQARIGLASREIQVRQEVLSQLKGLYQLQADISQNETDRYQAQEELELARTLGRFAEDSYQMRRLEFNIENLEAAGEDLRRRYDADLARFEERLGMDLDSLPQEIPEPGLTVPATLEPEADSNVYLSSVNVALAETSLMTHGRVPSITLKGGLSTVPFEADTTSVTLQCVVSMNLFDAGITDIDRSVAEHQLAIRRIEREQALRGFHRKLEDYRFQADGIARSLQRLQREIELTGQELREKQELLPEGVYDEDDIAEVRSRITSLELQVRTTRIDGLALESRIKALSLADESR
jgi:outer membrane protein TolC